MSSNNGFWWFSSSGGGASADFDRLLETCTSSNLPSSTPPPITHSLTLSDLIRSSAVPASHAVKSLQKRLDHSNPNVQLLVISVIDVCVKNGGDGFLKEISGREFSEDCAQIISNPISNREVKQKLKCEFQNWALAFEAVPFLASSELVTNYRRLKTLGIEFPPKDPLATAAMVDSLSAPEWRDSDVCERCRTAFSFTNRKHHCRNCGGVFDGQCSSKKRALPHFGVTESVRVCDGCERSLAAGIAGPNKHGLASARRNSFSGASSHASPSKLSSNQNHHRSATIHSATSARNSYRYPNSTPGQSLGNALSREEADLERAIALSLQESAPAQRASFPHSRSATNHQSYVSIPSKPSVSTREDEANDPDLAAAIAASLRDVQPNTDVQPSAPTPASPSISLETLPSRPPLPPQNISEEHINTLLNFSAEVDAAVRLGQLFPTNADLNNRHVQAETARPILNRDLENAERKTQALRDMNEKLSQAVKLYDRLLSEQIMYRTQPVDSSATPGPTLQPYRTMASFQSDSLYQRNSNQGFATHGSTSGYSPNSTAPYVGMTIPVSSNFTGVSTSDSMAQVGDHPHAIQPNNHATSPNSSLQQYGQPSLQHIAPTDPNTPIMRQNQTTYSPEYSTIGWSNPQLTPSNPTHLPSTEALRPEDIRPAEATWAHSNNLPNNPHSLLAPPALQQSLTLSGNSSDLTPPIPTISPSSSGIYHPSVVQLAEGNQHRGVPDQFSSQDPSSNQATQAQYSSTDSALPWPVHLLGTSASPSHQDSLLSKLTNVSVNYVQPSHQTLKPPTDSSSLQAHPDLPNFGQEGKSAVKGTERDLTSQLPSAPQTTTEPVLSLPSFPNVPNTQLSWSGSNGTYTHHPHHHQWDQNGLDVSSTTRQEEVAPLIEL